MLMNSFIRVHKDELETYWLDYNLEFDFEELSGVMDQLWANKRGLG